MRMSYASKQALRDARHYNGGIIIMGKYHVECVRSDERIHLVSLFVYDNNILQPHQYNYERLVNKVLPEYYRTFHDISGDVFTDSQMIHELDSIRRFSSTYVDGYFVTVENRVTKENNYFRVIGKEELRKIGDEWIKSFSLGKSVKHQEIEDYLARCEIKDKEGLTLAEFGHGTFRAERSLAINTMERFGGRLVKVKVIHGLDSWDSPGTPFHLHVKNRWGVDCLLTCKTGIPEIDCLYPIGTTANAMVNGVFWFCDEVYWKHLWIDKPIHFRWTWREGEPKPGDIPEGSQINEEIFDGKKYFFVPLREDEAKLSKLQSVKVNKRMFMPAHISGEKGNFISGMLIDSLPEHDGVVFYMPQSTFDSWTHRLGYESKCTFAQLSSFIFKGSGRGIKDEDYTEQFGIPVGEGKVSCVVLSQSIKSDMPFLVNEDGQDIEKPGSFISKKAICKNPKCDFYWSPINSQYDTCPECKSPTTIVKWFACGTEYAGIHKTDAQSNTKTGKLGSQIVKRVHQRPKDGKRTRIVSSLIHELKWIHMVARRLFRPNETFPKQTFAGDKQIIFQTNAFAELLTLINIFPKDQSFYQGSVGLLSAGLYPLHPRIMRKVREILAKAAITAKMERIVPSGWIVDPATKKEHHLQYGYYFAAPGFGLKEDEVRIPEKCKEAIFGGLATIPRYPQREGETDSPTLKVVGFSHGQVIENHPATMKLQGGDYDGDGLSVVPAWLTGRIVQQKITDIVAKGAKDVESVQDIIDSTIKAAEGKMGIGPVDNKITEIAFEALCLGQPLTEPEAAWCRLTHQGSISSIKHDVDEEAPCPTERLKTWYYKPMDRNPVTQIIFFDPSKKTVPKEFKAYESSHPDDQYAQVPKSKTNYYEWFQFLQNYGRYILRTWPTENPELAYRVNNHPLKEVLDIFCRIDLTKLETPILDFQRMYDESFKVLAKEELEYIKLNFPDHYKKVLVLIDYLKEQGTKYTTLVNEYSRNRDIGIMEDAGWSKVELLIHDTRKKIASIVDYLVEGNIRLKDHFHSAIYAAGGLATSYKDKPIKTSWQMWVTELPVIERMLAVHHRLFPSGLSPYYDQLVTMITGQLRS